MKLPVMFNSNFQIQDKDGNIIAELWRNPHAQEDGPRMVDLLNNPPIADFLPVPSVPEVEEVKGNGDVVHKPDTDVSINSDGLVVRIPINGNSGIKLSQSERMKAYWRKRREEKANQG